MACSSESGGGGLCERDPASGVVKMGGSGGPSPSRGYHRLSTRIRRWEGWIWALWRLSGVGGGCGGGGRNGKHDGHGSTQLWPDPTSRFENFIFFDQNSLYKLNMHACLQAIALPHAKMQVVRPPTYENQF